MSDVTRPFGYEDKVQRTPLTYEHVKRWHGPDQFNRETEWATLRAADYDALAARLAEAEHMATSLAGDLGRERIRAEAAEARVRELEHALRRASERLSWLRDHHCSSDFARAQANLASDECWRVQAGERAGDSARAGLCESCDGQGITAATQEYPCGETCPKCDGTGAAKP